MAVTPAGPRTLCAGGSTTLTAAALTSSFNASGDGFNNRVRAVLVQPDGKVLVGGEFTQYNSVDCPDYLVRLNPDGLLDASFRSGSADLNGAVLAGGEFTAYGGTSLPGGLVRFDANGSRDLTFGTGAGFDSLVRALALEPDGQVLAGGDFGSYNNVNGPSALTRLNPDGSPANYPATPPGVVYAWSNGSTGPTLSVTQPGLYQATASSGGCVAYSNTVRVDAPPLVTVTATPPGPVSLPAGGSVVLTAAATLPAFNPGGAGFDGGVNAILVQPDGKVLVGGRFTTYNGVNVPDHLVRLLPDGSLDAGFNAGGAGFTGVSVLTLALEPDGQVLVGGDIFTYNGLDVPDRLVRLNANGALDGSFNAGGGGFDGSIRTLALQPDGRVLAGGQFSLYNGANVSDGLVRLLPGGGLDASFNPGGAGFAASNVIALGLEADGQVVVGGRFVSYNGNGAVPDDLLRLNPDGSWDASYNFGGSGLDERVYALLILPDGKALIGGAFEQFNGQPFT